jgi:poly(glycerol-phosphate) alpha-glucosyltransferase
MKTKTILHCVNSFSSLSGGVGFALRALIEQVTDVNHVVLTLSDAEPILETDAADVQVFDRTGPYSLSYSRGLEAALLSATKEDPDAIVHVHGLWSGLGRSVQVMRRRRPGTEYLLSPHGMLSPEGLARRKVVKKVMGQLWENGVLMGAKWVHCLTAAEETMAKAYNVRMNTVILPHAIEFPYSEKELTEQWAQRPAAVKELLYLGRIHETKGLTQLVGVLSDRAKAGDPAPFRLKIAGIGQPDALDSLKRQIETSKAEIEFVGAAFGAAKQNHFSCAHGLILPSQTEGLPMTLMEAASYGLPLFVTEECNLDWIKVENAGAMVPFGPDCTLPLIDAFARATMDELKTMGLNSAVAARARYSSEIVSDRWQRIYQSY